MSEENISISDKAKLLAFQNDNYLIEVFICKNQSKGIDLDLNSCYWLFRIEKLSEFNNLISLSCYFYKNNKEIQIQGKSDQFFYGILFYNKENIVSLGTEDEEYFNYRAEKQDWFPKRFYCENDLDIIKNLIFYEITENSGIKINIPELYKGEKIQFHFASSYSIYEDETYHGEVNLDSLFATDVDYEYILSLLNEDGIFIE